MIEHLDRNGGPCAVHTLDESALMHLATIGSRARGFHHDLASKLQGLVMAIDELLELTTETDARVATAVDSAQDSLRETLALLSGSRELAREPEPERKALDELVHAASTRARVTIQGEVPKVMTEVVVPAAIHAWALLFDLAAGPRRSCTLTAEPVEHGQVTLSLDSANPPSPDDSSAIAIASFVFARDGGALRCGEAGRRLFVTIQLAD